MPADMRAHVGLLDFNKFNLHKFQIHRPTPHTMELPWQKTQPASANKSKSKYIKTWSKRMGLVRMVDALWEFLKKY